MEKNILKSMQKVLPLKIGDLVYHKTADLGKGLITALLVKEFNVEYYIEWSNGDRAYYELTSLEFDPGYDPKLLGNNHD
jgi:hypothetical protein